VKAGKKHPDTRRINGLTKKIAQQVLGDLCYNPFYGGKHHESSVHWRNRGRSMRPMVRVMPTDIIIYLPLVGKSVAR
jgi:hypothetical protein